MGNEFLKNLQTSYDDAMRRIEAVTSTAHDREGDGMLTDAEVGLIGELKAKAERARAQLDEVSGIAALDNEVRDRVALVTGGGSARSGIAYRSAGEVVYDLIHQSSDESRVRLGAAMRAAEHMGTDKAATVATAGGLGGLTVAPVVGAVIDLHDYSMPLLSWLGARPAPDGVSFRRPRLVDKNFDTGVAEQAKQKEELASKAFDVLAETLDLKTYGGYLNVSQQVLTYVPAALDTIVGQLNRRLSARLETAVASAFMADATAATGVDMTDAVAVRAAVYNASATVYANTGRLASAIVMGPAGWAALGALSDLAGRPMFPNLGPVNADGNSSASTFLIGGLGLTGVVSPGIADDSLYLANDLALEAYVYRYPMLEAVEPSVLGRQLAVAASLATYKPITKEESSAGAGDAERATVVKIPAA